MTSSRDHKVLVFKKIGDPQTRWDSKKMGDKLQAAGLDASKDSPLRRANRAAIEKLLHDARAGGWDKAPVELEIAIYSNGLAEKICHLDGDYSDDNSSDSYYE